MIYVVSNIHGNHFKFKKLLKTIKFKEDDYMYILGDIVDYGDDSMELIEDLSVRYNIYTIVGEHDYRALRMLSGFEKMLKNGEAPSEEYVSEMSEWMQEGGKPTLDFFRLLEPDQKEGVLDYLADLSLFEEIEVGGKDYILVHAGIADFREGTDIEDLEELEPEAFFTEPLDLSKRYFKNKTIVVGHNPTTPENGGDGKIFYGNGSIAIDCGEARGGSLACLCLDNGKEYYI